MEQNKRKTVTVLLTRYNDKISKLLYYITGRGYTHASLALDEGEKCYYSFNFKGFRMEHPERHKSRCGNSIAYRLEVTKEEHEVIKKRIDDMEKHRDYLEYSSLGAFLCILRIPAKFRNHYFCSQFVAEILQLTKSIHLKKNASLYLPNDLTHALEHQNCLREIIYNPV